MAQTSESRAARGRSWLKLKLGKLDRKQKRHLRAQATAVLFGLGVCGVLLLQLFGGSSKPEQQHSFWRRLSNDDKDDDDLCSSKWDDWGGGEAFAFLVVTIYLFIGIGIICDDFFVPALEAISEKLDLTPDVAGATFLAAGSSAPELFTSVADTFGPSDSSGYGVGTIVGSAMFNILIIVALSAASTTEVLHIDYRPVTRDCGFYLSAIVLLAIVYNDGRVHWWEGMIMWFGYVLYIVFMVFNTRLLDLCPDKRPGGDIEETSTTGGGSTRNELIVTAEPDRQIELAAKADSVEMGQNEGGHKKEEAEEQEEEDGGDPDKYWERFEFPSEDETLDQVYWVVCLPFTVAFTFTVPDCSKTACQNYYVLSFIMSIAWIMALCVGMVTTCTYIGCILNVRPVVMGVCVLAVGTSVPDAMGSMIVAKNGEADMAIANAVGSNVFDVLLGLGVPWTIKGLYEGTATGVETCGVEVAVAILFVTVGLFFLVLVLNKWKMTANVGWTFLGLYIVYYIYQLLSAFDVLPASISVVCS